MPETVNADEKKDEGGPAAPETRHIVLQGFGGLKMLRVERRPAPSPGAGEVAIRVKAW